MQIKRKKDNNYEEGKSARNERKDALVASSIAYPILGYTMGGLSEEAPITKVNELKANLAKAQKAGDLIAADNIKNKLKDAVLEKPKGKFSKNKMIGLGLGVGAVVAQDKAMRKLNERRTKHLEESSSDKEAEKKAARDGAMYGAGMSGAIGAGTGYALARKGIGLSKRNSALVGLGLAAASAIPSSGYAAAKNVSDLRKERKIKRKSDDN